MTKKELQKKLEEINKELLNNQDHLQVLDNLFKWLNDRVMICEDKITDLEDI